MGPEDAEGGGSAAAQVAAEESAPRLEPISPVNPRRSTARREAVTLAKRTVAATRQRQKEAG